MNPGPVQEGAETARTLISNLKESPLTLALVVFNLAFIALSYFNGVSLRQSNERLFNLMIDNEHKTAEMLYNCVPTNKERDK